MMDIRARTVEHISNPMPYQPVNEGGGTLYDIYLECLSIKKREREIKIEPRNDCSFDRASDFVINKTAGNSIAEPRGSQPYTPAVSKEYMNQEMILPGFCNSSSLYPQADYSPAPMNNYHICRRDINGFSYMVSNQVVGTMASACDGNKMFSSRGVIKPASKMVTCPRSDGGGPTFRGSSVQHTSDHPPASYIQSHAPSVMQDECNQVIGKRGYKRHHWVQHVGLENCGLHFGSTEVVNVSDSRDLSYSGVFNDRDSDSTASDAVVDIQPPSKCRMIESPCSVVPSMTANIEVPPLSGKLKRVLSYSGVSTDKDSDSTGNDTAVNILRPSKRQKMESPCNLVQSTDQSFVERTDPNKELLSPTKDRACTSAKSGVTDNSPGLELSNASTLPEELTVGCKQKEIERPSIIEIKSEPVDDPRGLNPYGALVVSEEQPTSDHKEPELQVGPEPEQIEAEAKLHTVVSVADHKEQDLQVESKPEQVEAEEKSHTVVSAADYDEVTKSKDTKRQDLSMSGSFTIPQLKEHLYSFCEEIGQEATGDPPCNGDENICLLCAKENLLLAPTPIYCSSCRGRIKYNLIYYSTKDESGTRQFCCKSCFNGIHGTSINFQGVSISKSKLNKEKTHEQNEESWVQCNKCQRWLHQICALYNDKRDFERKGEYVCPKCCLEELESGVRMPLSESAVFGAKDLPRTMLSDHIEERLFSSLKQEREETARALGKEIDEVPGAADLVVRVVLSVEKKLEVKQEYRDIFHGENYPVAFPYKSKAILLFQKIAGVDVCIFAMYVQEFGSECSDPNQRCIYISYLDSVKYFRPERETVTGEALRTFVYHQLLIGYLDYCKKRGFVTCHLWACPPSKGDDYILNCHPETQKAPKADKLRAWYKCMLRKAAKENIVVDYTNLYEEFFVPRGECNTKITAARLPYFDGDFWSSAAVDIVKDVNLEKGGSQKVKKLITKRTVKAMGHNTPSGATTKDILVMQKLGQSILGLKEDFIVVHLQLSCTCCHEVIVSGSRWFCDQCKKFQLCPRCADLQKDADDNKTHTSTCGEKHQLVQVVVRDVPVDTEDKDVTIHNEFFDNRHNLLGFCQQNNYQFDTLRRAKHSSMMILYQLRKTTKLTGGPTSSVSNKDVTTEDRPRCLKAPELLSLLKHSQSCKRKRNTCEYDPNCSQLRMLFHHASSCKIRCKGECKHCRKVWLLLKKHSEICRDSDCKIPRCRDLKERKEMAGSQSKSQQKVAR